MSSPRKPSRIEGSEVVIQGPNIEEGEGPAKRLFRLLRAHWFLTLVMILPPLITIAAIALILTLKIISMLSSNVADGLIDFFLVTMILWFMAALLGPIFNAIYIPLLVVSLVIATIRRQFHYLNVVIPLILAFSIFYITPWNLWLR
jgi:hypothetical protein